MPLRFTRKRPKEAVQVRRKHSRVCGSLLEEDLTLVSLLFLVVSIVSRRLRLRLTWTQPF